MNQTQYSLYRQVHEQELGFYEEYNQQAKQLEELIQKEAPGIQIIVEQFAITPDPVLHFLRVVYTPDEFMLKDLFVCRAKVYINKSRFEEPLQWMSRWTISKEALEDYKPEKIAGPTARALADELKEVAFLGHKKERK